MFRLYPLLWHFSFWKKKETQSHRLRSHCQFLGLTTAFPLQVRVSMSRSHSSLQLCLDTVCMNVRRESSLCYTPVTIATVTKVKSKMAPSIKLKVLSRELIHQIFINRPQLFNLGGEQSIWIAPTHAEHKTDGSGSGGKLTGSKYFRWHAANFSIAVSYQNT